MGLLTPDMVANLINYQYHGSDASIVLNNVYRPLLNRLILCFPRNTAPNFITLLGFFAITTGMLLSCYFSPDFTTPLPRGIYAVNAVLTFSYSMLDNLDGKQARRTQTSSAFGELFDHGVDAIASTCISIMWAASVQLGRSPLALMLPFVIYAPFYTATWECYWVGGLHLGSVNGPIEGILALVFGLLAGAIFGPQLFTKHALTVGVTDLTVGQVITLGTVASGAFYIVLNIYTVLRYVQAKRDQPAPTNQDVELGEIPDANGPDTVRLVPKGADRLPAPSVKTALAYLLPLTIFTGSGYVWLHYSPPETLSEPLSAAFPVPANILLVLAFLPVFAHLCSMMSLLHLCKMPYRYLFPIQIPMVVAALNALIGYQTYRPLVSHKTALISVLLVEYIIQIWFYYRAISEITAGLRINVLSLTAEQLARLDAADKENPTL